MKKRMIMLLTLLTAVIGTYADNTLTASGSIAKANGSKGTLTVSMTNDVAIKGVELTLNLPDGISVSTAETTTRSSALSSTYTADTKKMTLSTTSENTIAAGEGVILNITINATSELNTGTQSATLTDVVLSKSGTEDIKIASVSYNIEVTDKVVLDEESTVLPVNQENVNVTVKRTLNANVWNTMCLPFALTKELADAAFGSDATICYLESVTTPTSSDNSYKLNFTIDNLSTQFKAGYPFIVKPTSDKTELSFTGVNIEASSAIVEEEIKTGRTLYATFYGTLCDGTTIPADNIFLGTDNKFYYSDGSNTIKGFRGYFDIEGFSSSAGARQIKLMVDGQETTGIEGLYINGEAVGAEGVYNLKGQRVDMPTQKGVYIKDGKKVVIK